MLGTAGICSARTWRSGSATVISAPSTKHSSTGSAICFERLRDTPMPWPMGVIDMSTPRVNTPMPPISSRAPKRKRTMAPGSSGAMVMDSRNTMAVMGRTEDRDSLIFSMS